ncbi:cytochrome P450 2G1-like isoform X2 [Ranitomeya imitator]|uniref:cytochrome P450 2G1-like isoform X2 n=1 Tax=Ranitomeya imitator TaxID=111125 RepID=UPI0037E94B8F
MEWSPGLCSSILLALLLLFMVKKLFGKSGNLPPGPRPLPILGNLLQLKSREIHKPILELSKKYGPIYTLYMGPKPAVVLCGFQAVKEALVDNGDKFSGRAEFPIVDLTSKGYGIAFSNGERWKELRRFSLSTLRDFGVGRRSHEEWIQEEIHHLLDIFQETNGSLFSPAFFIRRSISNVICSVIFGRRFDYTDPKLQTLLDLVAENLRRVDNIWVQLYNFIPSILYYFPGPHHKLTENYQAQLDYAEAIVREHEATLDPSSPRDYVDAFLIKMQQASKNPHSEFNLPNLLSSALDIFFAGQESTSSTLGYGLLILLKYPDIKKKVQAEIENVVGRTRRPCMEDRVKMPYTEAVIHEFMRFIDFFPLGVPHAVTENTIFRGYTLPKGTVIFPVLHSVLYDQTVFKRPQEFYPEHFLDQNGSFKKCEGFMAFSAGKRSCPGEGLARTELFLYLTSILQKFDIRSDIPPEDIDLSPEYSGVGKMAPTFQCQKKYGPIFTIYLGSRPTVVLCGYDAVKEALIDNKDVFSGRGKMPVPEYVLKGYGIIGSNGDRWKQMRRFALTTLRNFGMGKRRIEERIQEEAQFLVEEFSKTEGELFDPTFFFSCAVSNIICSVLFGKRFSYKDERFLSLLKNITGAVRFMNSVFSLIFTYLHELMRHIPGPHQKGIQHLFELKAFIQEEVEKSVNTLNIGSTRHFIDCFLVKMQQEKQKPTSEFHNENLVGSSMNLFFAGTETTSATLRYGFLALLKYPEIQAKIQDEIHHVIGDRQPSAEDRTNMPYTEAVICEIQRFSDIVPTGVPHCTTEDILFRNYTIPKGTNVFPLLTTVLKDPEQFPQPELFSPDRFLDDKGAVKKQAAFMPFSAGRRICIGEGLARMELFLFLTTLLQKFTLTTVVPTEDLDLSPEFSSAGHLPRSYKMSAIPRH